MANRRLRTTRIQAPWGVVIPAVISGISSIAGMLSSNNAAKRQARMADEQLAMQKQQLDYQTKVNEAQAYNQMSGNLTDVNPNDRFAIARGGKIKLKRAPIVVEAGGAAINSRDKSGKPIILFKGNTHDEPNEVGGTGIYANIAGQPVEVENEVVGKNGDHYTIISDRIKAPNGKTLADAVEDKDITINEAEYMQDNKKKRLRTTSPVGRMYGRPRADLGAKWKPVDYGLLAVQSILPFFARKNSRRYYNRMDQMYADFDKYLDANGSFAAPAPISMNTNFNRYGLLSSMRRQGSNAITQNTRNTASSNVARNNAQTIGTNVNDEINKVLEEDQQTNLKARMANAQMVNEYNANIAKMMSDYRLGVLGLKGQLFADRMGMYQRRDDDNTALIQNLADAAYNFANIGSERYQQDINNKLLMATAQGDTLGRLRQFAPELFNRNQLNSIDDILMNDKGYYGFNKYGGGTYRLRNMPSVTSRINSTYRYVPSYNTRRLTYSMLG